MKKLYGLGRFLVLFIFMLMVASVIFAADVPVTWIAAAGASGYKLEYSIDNGGTWSAPKDVGMITPVDYVAGGVHLLICSYTWTGLPDAGLVLIRATAYNSVGNATNTGAGAWFNKSWAPPPMPTGTGVK